MNNPKLIVHRSADEIGGNCIELAWGTHRLILDIGRPLTAKSKDVDDSSLLPPSLDISSPVDGIIISHPHQDHYGLIQALPDNWPVWCGVPTETLIKLTGKVFKINFSHEVKGSSPLLTVSCEDVSAKLFLVRPTMIKI